MSWSDSASSLDLWPVRPPPQDQEIFSGWLARIGQAHGITPRRFVSRLRANMRAGKRDLDARPSYELIAEVSRRTGVPYARLLRMTVRWHVEPLAPLHEALRTGDTFGYCPLCWAEDVRPYIRRAWRLRWTPACALHRILLSASCSQCRYAPSFHFMSAHQQLYLCSRCSFDLRQVTLQPWPGHYSDRDVKTAIENQEQRFQYFESTYYG